MPMSLGEDDEDMPPLMIVCTVGWRSELMCEDLVDVYVGAVGEAPQELLVGITVDKFGGNDQRCSGVYASTGELLRDGMTDEQTE